jgi:hypothetical protein
MSTVARKLKYSVITYGILNIFSISDKYHYPELINYSDYVFCRVSILQS